MSLLPGKRAFFGTFATGILIQAMTLLTGAMTARLLGPEGRGQFAGAQVWPSIIGMIALFGMNTSLSVSAAKMREKKYDFERIAILVGAVSSVVCFAVGWLVMPWLVPVNNPELLLLSRFMLLLVPLFVFTSNLMAIDQGVGDYKIFNIARNILTPCYLLLLIGLWLAQSHDPACFLAALIAANLAVLVYRLKAGSTNYSTGAAPKVHGLLRAGLPFWITAIVAILRDNAERLLLMFLLGPVSLGLYVVAFTASSVHMNVSKSLNLIVFTRSATLGGQQGLNDAARFFRMMGLMNFALGLGMVAVIPLLIHIIFGRSFAHAILPSMLLVAAQFCLAQGSILDEALRGRSKPFIGLLGMLTGMVTFALLGMVLARTNGLIGVAIASICGQLAYMTWMMTIFRRKSGGAKLLPNLEDLKHLKRITQQIRLSAMDYFLSRAPA